MAIFHALPRLAGKLNHVAVPTAAHDEKDG